MKRFFCLILVNIFLEAVSAQQLPVLWQQTFQGQGKASDRIEVIDTDASGNIYVAGYAGAHHGSPDAFVMKRNSEGDTLWTYYYDSGSNNEDYALDLTIDNAENVYITGKSQSASYFYECFVAKILPGGIQSWVVRYSPGNNTESCGNAITVDASGNVYVVGYSDPTSGSYDWLVIKYNSAGIKQWADVLNGPGNGDDEAMDIVIASNGNPTVCGYTYSNNASGSINSFVKQYTPSNAVVWTDTWTNPDFIGVDKAFSLGNAPNGDILIGGETRNSASFNMDAFAIRYNSSGVRQWTSIYSDQSSVADEYLRKVCFDNIGNIFFTGTDYQKGYVSCIKSDGELGWRKTWNGPALNGSDVFHSIVCDMNGNVYVTGRGVYQGSDYYGNGGLPNMIITKYNSLGDSLWTYRCQDSLNSSMGFSIAYRNGKLYAGGFVTDTASIDENLYTLIIDTAGNAEHEWIFNGKGDAMTMAQFVQTDGNDNIYCGATIDRLYNEGTDIVFIKYSPSGNLLWEKYYSSPGFNNDTLTAMQFDPNGNLIVCISSDIGKTKNNYRLSLLKIESSGNFLDTVWLTENGSILANSMDISNAGNIAIAATSNLLGGTVIFFNSEFNSHWIAKFDSTQYAVTKVNNVDFFPNGDFAIAGYSQVSGVSKGVIQRYSDVGIKIWTALVDSLNVYDEIRSIFIRSENELAFTGSSGTFAIVGTIEGTTGNINWVRTYNPNTTSEYGVKVSYTNAGNVVFICRGWTGYVSRYFTIQYSEAGVFQWASVYSQTASDREPVDIIIENNNVVVTAGWAINTYTTNYDYVLVGYSSVGTVFFINTYNTVVGTLSTWDQLQDLTRDSQSNYIVTGKIAHEFYNNYLFKIHTIKYGGLLVGENEKETNTKAMALVYPNPSSDGVFYLLDASPVEIQSAQLIDPQGRQIRYITLESEKIDLSDVKAGMYYLVLQRKNLQKEFISLIIN